MRLINDKDRDSNRQYGQIASKFETAILESGPDPLFKGTRLIDRLKIHSSNLEYDLDDAKRNRTFVSPDQLTRTSFALSSSKFTTWMSSHQSNILVVQGNDTGTDGKSLSALSYYASSLHTWIKENDFAFPLTFFCVLHSSTTDKIRGVVGMVRSFLFQLLEFYGREISFIGFPKEMPKAVENGDIMTLTKILWHCLDGPLRHPGTVVMIIDGAHLLESTDQINDFALFAVVLENVLAVTQDNNSRGTFKVLFLFPNISNLDTIKSGDDSLLDVKDDTKAPNCTTSTNMLSAMNRVKRLGRGVPLGDIIGK